MDEETVRYWLNRDNKGWRQCTEHDYIAAERECGVHPVEGTGAATTPFFSRLRSVEGRVICGPVTRLACDFDSALYQAARLAST